MHQLLPLTSSDCGNLRWRVPVSLAYLQSRDTLPVQIVEAGRLAGVMALAFCRDTQQPSGWSLVVVCGRQKGSNVYIDHDGLWLAHIKPESVKHLPFSLLPLGKGKVLPCFDKTSNLLCDSTDGELFFDVEGQFAGEARSRIDALVQWQFKVQQTQAAVAALVSARLVIPWSPILREKSGVALDDLYTLDEKALHALDDETFTSLRKSGALTLAYAVAFSLNQCHMLARLERMRAGKAPALPVDQRGELDLEFLNKGGTISFGG